ncbi:FadR/GntR family transcriptional regulator [Intrasporangium sp.]|jgi:DNA-binding FadR family transcriptional regulator|uniref:FadR/GntR family transcriptional regulator n=1 Tax=Intrasporangium sp. TaxID=1925024 RepID=UPI0033657826
MSSEAERPPNSAVRPLGTGLHAHVVDALGTAIAGGRLEVGTLLYIDDLMATYSVSRPVIRECLRVLSSMGLVESRRRVGTVIRPTTAWNVFDPQVIRWRLASDARGAQLRSLTELRVAIEPEAARLAAKRANLSEGSALVGLAAKMWTAGKEGDLETFLALDVEFHHLVLAGSGNEMFLKLSELVGEVLSGRHEYGLMPGHPDDEALTLHADVAQAIHRRDEVLAREAMRQITLQALEEMSGIWAQTTGHPITDA